MIFARIVYSSILLGIGRGTIRLTGLQIAGLNPDYFCG